MSDAEPQQRELLPAHTSGVISYTDDEDRHHEVREFALDLARREHAALVLYALDAYTPLADPIPNETWSAESDEGLYGDPLSVDDLERLGREQLAGQVLAASRAGIQAGAWIPRKGGVEAMVEYALGHDANVVLLPEAIRDAGLLDRLQGVSVEQAAEADAETPVHLLLVATDGTVTRAAQAREEARS